jgi:hypothetical protein
MATLKSIKNKYLAASDGATLGVSDNADNVALLAFKMQATDSIAKFNMVDGFSDAYADATGVDASASTNETRDATNYYSGAAALTVTSTGGTITTDGDYTIHKFTSDGTYETDVEQPDYELLLVGGGGAGGNNAGGGGGGGGGFNTQTGATVTATTHAVVVGAGGARATSWYPSSVGTPGSGGDSTFNDGATTWYGYGGGAGGNPSSGVGGTGKGSGGGGAANGSAAGAANTQNGSVGYAGGSRLGQAGGGGGGASATGVNATGSGGNGGAGQVSDILVTSSNVTYGGGGGGGHHAGGSAGSGGSGGGASGNGSYNTGYAAGGTDGLGGGGGGAAGRNTPPAGGGGGNGGTGVVIVRRPTIATSYNDMTLISTTTTAQATPTKGDLVMTYSNGAGTASIGDGTNGDIRAFVSRNNGTNYTQFTLADDGDTGGHTILTAHDLDISAQPSGTSMRYKITTHNQSAAKQTRIQAVSLAWA